MPRTKKKLHQHILHHTKHFFIPHKGNNHKPHALRGPALRIYSSALIIVKLFVTGFLFTLYPSTAEFSAITSSQILSLTNQSRQEAGVAPLTLNSKLNNAAQLKGKDMIADNYFAHTAPDGTTPWSFLKQAGYSYTAAGENLAMDFTEAESVHEALMNSESHRKNILNSKYKEMGIAVVTGPINGRDTILLVEFFGAPYVASATTQTTTTPTTTTKTQAAATTAPPPSISSYQAQLSDQSEQELAIKTLEEVSFWAEFKNTGSAAWTRSGNYFLALNVTNPAGRTSSFQHSTWLAYYRPAVLDQDRVNPGEVGRFTFKLKAPEEAGIYKEAFGLVAENLGWLSGGTIELPIVVVAPPEQATDKTVEVITTPTEPTITPPPTTAPPPPTPEPTTNTNAQVQAAHLETIVPQEKGTVAKIIDYAREFYLVILIFVMIALLINIAVKVRVQHPHIIFQSTAVIVLALVALSLKPHFLEKIPDVLRII